jgi:hypothetical protein
VVVTLAAAAGAEVWYCADWMDEFILYTGPFVMEKPGGSVSAYAVLSEGGKRKESLEIHYSYDVRPGLAQVTAGGIGEATVLSSVTDEWGEAWWKVTVPQDGSLMVFPNFAPGGYFNESSRYYIAIGDGDRRNEIGVTYDDITRVPYTLDGKTYTKYAMCTRSGGSVGLPAGVYYICFVALDEYGQNSYADAANREISLILYPTGKVPAFNGSYRKIGEATTLTGDGASQVYYATRSADIYTANAIAYTQPLVLTEERNTLYFYSVVNGIASPYQGYYVYVMRPPVASPPAGALASDTMVALSPGGIYDAEYGWLDSEIYYTTDGSEPTEGSRLYVEPIRVDRDMTIRAATLYRDSQLSGTAVFAYTRAAGVATVSISPADGTTVSSGSQTVTLAASPAGAEIYYTTDGTNPVPGVSARYSAPFVITKT